MIGVGKPSSDSPEGYPDNFQKLERLKRSMDFQAEEMILQFRGSSSG